MLPAAIALAAAVTALVCWGVFAQRRLVALDENANNAMSQLGVLLSGRFDALLALLDLIKPYEEGESAALAETVKARRRVITARSSPKDVLAQEKVLSEALSQAAAAAARHPGLKESGAYRKTIGAVEAFEIMARAGCLLYNDSAAKLNRQVRLFPASLLARMMGIRAREYLEAGPAQSGAK